MTRPLVVDLFCGKFGWSRGFVADGWRSVGFDVAHEPYHGDVPDGCSLALQDVLTLHGRQFRDAAAIVASPPCQAYSYRAMPWKRAKALPPPSNELFDACFRIQREASEAAGRHIPLVVENVKGAQPWVGPAKAHFGSFYLWGDVESVGGRIVGSAPRFGESLRASRAQKFNPDGTKHGQGSWFAIADSVNRGAHGQKVPGLNFHEFEKTGKPGRSFQSAAVEHTKGLKVPGINWSGHGEPGYKAQGFNTTAAQRYREDQGLKLKDMDGYERNHPDAFGWKSHRTSSCAKDSRKAASAAIAQIPFELAHWVARCLRPVEAETRELLETR